MKEFLDAEKFCRDAFAGELSDALREEIVLRMTRTRRVTRIADGSKVVAVLALISIGAVFLNRPARRAVSVVVTRGAPTSATLKLGFSKVHSAPFSGVVRSVPLAEQMVIRSVPTTLAIVHSDGPRGYQEITDEQMFRMLQGWSIALVKVNGVTELELLTQ